MPSSFTITSELHAGVEAVWAESGTMAGVNFELGPWIRMTTPARLRGLRIEDAPVGERAFVSWILAGGVVPVDRHDLHFEGIGPGRRFDERSTTWVQRFWCHHRHFDRVDDQRCRVTDRLEWQPRLHIAKPILEWVVPRLFRHRHRQLQRRYGGQLVDAGDSPST